MENLIKELNEKAKDLNLDSLIETSYYIDYNFKGDWKIAFVESEFEKTKYTLNILINNKQIHNALNIKRNKYNINPFRYNLYSSDYLIRNVILNEEYEDIDLNFIFQILEKKEEEIIKNKNSEISPYQIIQFLNGDLIDIIIRIGSYDFEKENNKKVLSDIIDKLLNFFNYVIKITLDNTEKIKIITNNPQYRKFIYIDKIFSIINSFDILFGSIDNLIDVINEENIKQMDLIKQIANNSYLLLIKCLNDKKYDIPLYYFDIICNAYFEWFIEKIDSYDINNIFNAYTESILNLSENELKNIKKPMTIININKRLSNNLIDDRNKNEKIYDKLNFIYIYRCLNSQILEKKINSVNLINEMISSKGKNEYFNERFVNYLIKEKNILSILLGESVHDEVLKRTNIIFHYLASFNQIPDSIIKQLIDNKKIILIQKIISDIVSVLPIEKRNKIFNECTKDMDLSINENIEFIKNLTDNCLNYSNLNIEEKKILKESKVNLYGIDTLYNYIMKNRTKDDCKNNNILIAIEALVQILSNSFTVNDKIIYNYLEQIFENMNNNDKHYNIIQSIELIENIFDYCFEKRTSKEKFLQMLDDKYDIITLFVNDLTRYMNNITKGEIDFKFNNDEIYEGIYEHKTNIKVRLNIIFFFVEGEDMRYSLDLKGKEHLEKLFEIFKKQKNEKLILFDYLNSYVEINPDKETLEYFFKVILRNNEYINLKEIDEKRQLHLIITVFKIINSNESLIFDGKNMRVKLNKIEGIDLLYEILLNNNNQILLNTLCEELTNLCLYLFDYSKSFSENYWKNYIEDIINKLNTCIKNNNKNGINSLIYLIDFIYSKASNFQGKIPEKKDIQTAGSESELYHFYCDQRKKKEYKIKVGLNEILFDVRWRIGYYYDINVNDVVFENYNKEKFNFMFDFYRFMDIFPSEKYGNNINGNYKFVYVKGESNQLLKLNVNPKNIIESNENVIDNFLQLLKKENQDEEIKEKVWKLFNKLPIDYYIKKKIIKLFKDEDKNMLNEKNEKGLNENKNDNINDSNKENNISENNNIENKNTDISTENNNVENSEINVNDNKNKENNNVGNNENKNIDNNICENNNNKINDTENKNIENNNDNNNNNVNIDNKNNDNKLNEMNNKENSKIENNTKVINNKNQTNENNIFNNENEIKELFNSEEIYLLTYTFKCMRIYLTKNVKNEKDLLKYFIEKYKGDKILIEIFHNFKINTDKKEKKKIILFFLIF